MQAETLTEFIARLKSEGFDNYGFLEMPTNNIAKAVIKQTGVDWEETYPQLFRTVIEILMKHEKEYNKMVLNAFSHHFSSYFFLHEKGLESCKELSEMKEKQAYVKGYNEAVAVLKYYFDNQERLVNTSIEKAFTLKCN
jgi:hypothetical protein